MIPLHERRSYPMAGKTSTRRAKPRAGADRGGTTRGELARARELLTEVSTIVPHTDADGLASGAMALRLRGESAEAAVLLGRGQMLMHESAS
jgi:hypothetical protein